MGITAVPVVISRCGLDRKLRFETLHHNFAWSTPKVKVKSQGHQNRFGICKNYFRKTDIFIFQIFYQKSMLSRINGEKIKLGEETQGMLVTILL
jgi:hypothetical protein